MINNKHIVKEGDTINKIASNYSLTLNELYIANPQLEYDDYIYPNEIINIPNRNDKQYIINKGDTINYIAKLYGLNEYDLLSINPQLNNKTRLKTGMVINIKKRNNDKIVKTNYELGYRDLKLYLDLLIQKYPFLHVEIIGKSVMGKSIYAIRLGKGNREVFYSSDWHANEHLTGLLLTKFIEDYANALTNSKSLIGYKIQELFSAVSIWLVPMVNPDGVELVLGGITPKNPYYKKVVEINYGLRDFKQWTANINGVDLNHQWPANWIEESAKSKPYSSNKKYGGSKPLSEPESIAIYEFTKKHNFNLILSFHSQGQLIYWGYNNLEPLESQNMVNNFSRITGYEPVKLANSAAGYKDWFIQEYRKPGFTIEVGNGINPLPINQFSQIYKDNLSLLLEAAK